MPLGTHLYYLSALTVVRGLVRNYRQTQHTIVRSPARAPIAGGERSHAVALGSSFAGLFTASVLADQGWRVTLIEKDALEADAGGVDSDAVQRSLRCRSGVPQARHLHTLHAGGARAAEEILPGVLDDPSWLRRAASTSTSARRDLSSQTWEACGARAASPRVKASARSWQAGRSSSIRFSPPSAGEAAHIAAQR